MSIDYEKGGGSLMVLLQQFECLFELEDFKSEITATILFHRREKNIIYQSYRH